MKNIYFTDGSPRRSVIKRRRRLISKLGAMSPNCLKLYRLYDKSRRQLTILRRARRANKITKEKSFEKLTEKMNPLTKKLIYMQMTQCTKKSKGRRFSDEEKLIALSVMKQSPKCYRFLHKLLILPSKTTLNKMIQQLKIGAGINSQIFDALKQEVSNYWFC